MSPLDERSRPGTTPNGSNAQQTLPAANTVHGTATDPVHGGDIAAETADVVELSALIELITSTAEDGQITCACRAYPLDHLGELRSPNVLGAAFHVAAQAGLIEHVGYHRAVRRARQSGVHAIWRGRVVA